jgi:hypothetical protein
VHPSDAPGQLWTAAQLGRRWQVPRVTVRDGDAKDAREREEARERHEAREQDGDQ